MGISYSSSRLSRSTMRKKPSLPVTVSRLRSLPLCPKDRAHLAQVPVMHVDRNKLVVPEKLSGLDVERDHRIRIEVRAGADLAIKIGGRITHRHEEDALLRIERQGRPEGAAAMLARLRIGPGFRPRLVCIRDEVEAPNLFAGFELE